MIRAIAKLTGQTWDQVYLNVCMQGFDMAEMPSTNSVWEEYLYNLGYREYPLPNTCPRCYTVERFCEEYPEGKYLVATGTHVVAVEDGDYYDAWNSGKEWIAHYWTKEDAQ